MYDVKDLLRNGQGEDVMRRQALEASYLSLSSGFVSVGRKV